MKVILTVEDIIRQASTSDAYKNIHPDVIRRVAESESNKGYKSRDLVKAIRSKLHQVGGAYFPGDFDGQCFSTELALLPHDLSAPEIKSFCLLKMKSHASTNERLAFLDNFFLDTLSDLAPIHSVLDVACGLTPLAIPWMPLAGGFHYTAVDMYMNLINAVEDFFHHTGVNGETIAGDMLSFPLDNPVDIVFVLKTLPCLEQQQKGSARELLDRIQARHILVSYPLRSLGGNQKGMRTNYEADFNSLVAGKSWAIKRFEFPSELVFRIDKQ
jgi:16S rRNA (guanine(1405)-N(7))-methyltransferase